MPLLANIDKVAYASKYPTDKILKVLKGSFTIGASDGFTRTYGETSIPHGYNTPVLVKMQYSLNQTTWIDENTININSSTGLFMQQVIAYSTPTNIVVYGYNNETTSRTIHYRIVLIADDNFSTTITTPVSQTSLNKSLFDWRFNYQKIYLQGKETVSSPSTSVVTPTILTIFHDLGYFPATRLFYSAKTNEIWPAHGDKVNVSPYYLKDDNINCQYLVYNNRIEIELWVDVGGTARPVDIYYRIYLDGQS